ncbi:MAG: hypothetical protein ACUVR4_06565 [Anaerolineae bacterium]
MAEVSAELPAVTGPQVGAEVPAGDVVLPEGAIEALTPQPAAPATTDDLTRISGVGPKYAAQLAAAGIHHLCQACRCR